MTQRPRPVNRHLSGNFCNAHPAKEDFLRHSVQHSLQNSGQHMTQPILRSLSKVGIGIDSGADTSAGRERQKGMVRILGSYTTPNRETLAPSISRKNRASNTRPRPKITSEILFSAIRSTCTSALEWFPYTNSTSRSPLARTSTSTPDDNTRNNGCTHGFS